MEAFPKFAQCLPFSALLGTKRERKSVAKREPSMVRNLKANHTGSLRRDKKPDLGDGR
jgi:hypothetical protein